MLFLLLIASKICKRPCRIQDYISTKPSDFTLSRLLSPCFSILKKLAGASAAPLGFFNILATTFADLGVPQKVYTNEGIPNIIWIIIKAKLAVVEGSCKHFFKARFSNIYRGNNHIACWKFCQQYKDYFTITKVKRPNCILFAAFFL